MAKDSGFTVFVAFALALFVGAPLSALMCGWTASVLWGWFVVPEIKPLSMQAWYGIGLVFGLLAFSLKKKDADEDRGALAAVLIEQGGYALGCLILLGAAAIVKGILGW